MRVDKLLVSIMVLLIIIALSLSMAELYKRKLPHTIFSIPTNVPSELPELIALCKNRGGNAILRSNLQSEPIEWEVRCVKFEHPQEKE